MTLETAIIPAFADFSLLPRTDLAGALALGVVLGWNLYFINRYRSGPVAISDLGAVVTAVAGAGVLGFLGGEGPGRGALAGAYGVGLLLGFAAYGLMLRRLVAASDGAFNALFFLDGRRKVLPPGWEIPGGPVAQKPAFLPPNWVQKPLLAGAGDGDDEAAKRRAETDAALGGALTAVQEAAIDVSARRIRETDAEVIDTLVERQKELGRIEIAILVERDRLARTDPAVASALATLNEATGALNDEAALLSQVGDALAKAADVVEAAQTVLEKVSVLPKG